MMNLIKKSIASFMVVVMLLTASPLSGFIGLDIPESLNVAVEAEALDSRIEKAIQWAISIANDNTHGYSQENRNGPDYDCSSFVSTAFKNAGFPVSSSLHTGNMLNGFVSAGFKKYNKGAVSLQRGDILLRPKTSSRGGHTELYIGNNQCVAAHSNKDGKSGDSSGNEIDVRSKNYCTFCKNSDYTYVLRYEGTNNYDNYTYSFSFNANGGTLGSSGAFNVKYGEQFQVLNTTCTRSGYTWAGWNVKRNNDNKWYVDGQGWCTESEINNNGYIKRVYPNYKTLTFDNSWTSGMDGNLSYTFYAVWMQTRSTKIKVFLSPYDNGYDHITAMNNSANSGFTQEQIYAWYVLYDGNTGELLNTYSDKNYSVKLEICDAEGNVVKTQTYSDSSDVNCIGVTPQMQGTYTITATISGDYKGSHSTSYKVFYDPELFVSHDKISLNLNGTNNQTVTIDVGGAYPGKYNIRRKLSNSNVSTSWGSYSGNSCTLNVTGNKVGNTDITIELFEEYTGNKNVVATLTIPVTITANTYTISYNANGGSGAPSSQQKSHGTDLTLSSTVPTGKTYTVTFNGNGGNVATTNQTYTQYFKCWNTKADGTGASYNPGGVYSNNTTQTLYAKWENRTLHVNNPVNDNYYFLGWYDSNTISNGKPTGKRYTNGTVINKNLTLYAMWATTLDLTVFWGDYDLSGSLDPIDVTAVNSIAFDKINYTDEDLFRCDVNADGIVTQDDVTMLNQARSGQINMYTMPAYVYYKNISVKQNPYKTTYNYGENFNCNGLILQANYSNGIIHTMSDGYIITGYDPYKIGKQTLTVNYYFDSTTITITVQAPQYTLYYDANGGSVSSSGKTVTYNSSVGTLPTPERDGYKFLGWSFSENSTSYITSSTVYSYKSNKTLYAQWEKIAYTLSYNSAAGSGVPKNQTGNTSYTISSIVPELFGYTFLGWTTNKSSSAVQYEMGDIITLSNDTTLYAVWKPATTILYAGASYSTSIDYAKQERYYTFTPSTSGNYVIYSTDNNDTKVYLYNSSGTELKNDDNGSNNNNFRLQYNLTAGTTYYYKIVYSDTTKTGTIPFVFGKVYSISYNANGGSGAPSSQNKDYGVYTTLSATVPTREGYTFLGWATSATAITAEYYGGENHNFTSDITLYAVWKANTYTVKYNANGGTGSMADSTHTYDTSKALSSNAFSKTGYTFLGWSTSNTATSATYTNGQSVKNLTSTNGGTVTLYAVWKANTYTVKYNANGGTGSMADSNHTYDTSKALSSNAFSKTGYTFLGWSTSSTATTVTYTNSQSVKNLTSTNGGTLNLYAVWGYNDTIKPSVSISSTNNVATSQTVTLNMSDNVGVVSYYWGTSCSPANSSFTSITSTTSKSVTKTVSEPGTYYLIAKDTAGNVSTTASITLYKTTLNGNNGTVTPDYVLTKSGDSFTLPTGTRTGYTFLGWSTSSTATIATYSAGSSYKSTANATLYAVWKQNDATKPTVSISSTNNVTIKQTVTLTMSDDTGIISYYWGTAKNPASSSFTSITSATSNTETKTVTESGTYYLIAKDAAGNVSTTESITFCMITFDINVGSVDPAYMIINNSSKIKLPEAKKEGLVFLGWATNKAATSADYPAGSTYNFEKDIILYPVWKTEKPDVILGDVNGDDIIDAGDAVIISRYDAGFITLTEDQLAAADVNNDGVVDAGDAVIISRYDAGFISSLK